MSYTEYRTLSIRKDREKAHTVEPIFLREGDKGMTIAAYLVDAGERYFVETSATFCAVNADGGNLEVGATVNDADHDLVEYTLGDDLTSKAGKIAIAYFKILDNSGDVSAQLSTDSIPIVVLPAADINGKKASAYESEIEQLIKDASDAYRTIEQMLDNLQKSIDEKLVDPTVAQNPEADSARAYPILTKEVASTDKSTSEVQFTPAVTITPSTQTVTAQIFAGDLSGNAETANSAIYAEESKRLGSADVGSATKPIYLDAGTATECGDLLDADITGNAASANSALEATHAASADAATTATTADEAGIAAKVAETAIDNSTVLLNDDGQLMASATGNVEFENLPEFTLEWTKNGELLMVGGGE